MSIVYVLLYRTILMMYNLKSITYSLSLLISLRNDQMRQILRQTFECVIGEGLFVDGAVLLVLLLDHGPRQERGLLEVGVPVERQVKNLAGVVLKKTHRSKVYVSAINFYCR